MFKLHKPEVNVRHEIHRRRSQTARILELLKSGQYVTNVDLAKIALNYTMRVSDLRKDGHKILANYVRPGVFSYTYKGRSDD